MAAARCVVAFAPGIALFLDKRNTFHYLHAAEALALRNRESLCNIAHIDIVCARFPGPERCFGAAAPHVLPYKEEEERGTGR